MPASLPQSQGSFLQTLQRYVGQLAFLDTVAAPNIVARAIQSLHIGLNQVVGANVDFKTLSLNHINHPPWIAAPDWTSAHAYTVGQFVTPSAAPNLSLLCYRCVVAGTSGGSPPAWLDPTQQVSIGAQLIDGTVTWQLWGFAVLIDPALLTTAGTNPITGTGVLNLTIAANTDNYNIFNAAGKPGNIVNVTLTINSGVVVGSTATNLPALDTGSGWAAGSTITITNLGTIAGHGGRGGHGGPGNTAGTLGGDALALHWAITLANDLGTISGGGGGGGGGGYGLGSGNYGGSIYGGGGGGGGAGQDASAGGAGGQGASNGKNGGAGSLSAGGIGGTGGKAVNGGTAGGKGGNGGGPGQVGQAGQTSSFAGSAGGAAGNAVRLNGQTLTWSGLHGVTNGGIS